MLHGIYLWSSRLLSHCGGTLRVAMERMGCALFWRRIGSQDIDVPGEVFKLGANVHQSGALLL